jgi:hypothetical protein
MVVRDGCPGVAGVSQVMEVNPARSALPDHRGTAATPIPTSVMCRKLASLVQSSAIVPRATVPVARPAGLYYQVLSASLFSRLPRASIAGCAATGGLQPAIGHPRRQRLALRRRSPAPRVPRSDSPPQTGSGRLLPSTGERYCPFRAGSTPQTGLGSRKNSPEIAGRRLPGCGLSARISGAGH